jgi:VRR-NUC domain
VEYELLTYPKELMNTWRTGALARRWRQEFPDLFRARDYEIIQNQFVHGFHLGEWFVARHYWTQGHRVLIEKYAFESHPEAYAIAAHLLGKSGLEFIHAHRLSCQPPDLLIYEPDMSSFFFAEVKRHRDRMKPAQQEFFETLERRFGCRVVVVSLQPKNTE